MTGLKVGELISFLLTRCSERQQLQTKLITAQTNCVRTEVLRDSRSSLNLPYVLLVSLMFRYRKQSAGTVA